MSTGLINTLLVFVVCYLLPHHQVFCLQDDAEIPDCDSSFIPPQTNLTHSCRYRDLQDLYPPNLWRWVAGFGCYNYSLVGTRNVIFPHSTCKIKYNNEYYPIFYTELGGYKFLYDHTDELSRILINRSYTEELFFQKWITCSVEAEECCDDFMLDNNVLPTEDYPCPALWDGWHCFPPTRAGTISKVPCSTKAFLTSNTNTCILYTEKQCFSNGEWNQTSNTLTCVITTLQQQRHNFHIIVLAVSTLVAVPAIVIFFAFPKLRILRVILHRNLLVAVVCRNVISIVVKSTLILEQLEGGDDSVMQRNTVGCRVLVFFENVAKNAIFTAMLVDGFYLHKLIVRVFAKDPKGYILHGVTVVFSVIPALIWAIIKGIYSNDFCWLVETDADAGSYHWIIDGYRLATLAINLLLLIDILRVLWFKVAKNSDTTTYVRSNLRVTVFLLPLFGVHFLIVADTSIAGETCAAENAYYIASYSLEALQGVLIALGFCYLNSEVHRNIKNGLLMRFPQLRLRRNNHSRMNTDISLVGNSATS